MSIPPGAPIVVSAEDPALAAEATQVAAATGRNVLPAAGPAAVRRACPMAAALVADSAELAALAEGSCPAFVVAAGPATGGGFALPAEAPRLLAELGAALRPGASKPEPSPGRPGPAAPAGSAPAIGVVGACGGAGASTLAAAAAQLAAAEGGRSALVEAAGDGGGVDLLFGAERAAGTRWPELDFTAGALPAGDLLAALPATRGGVALLSAARRTESPGREPAAEELEEAVGSLRQAAGLAAVLVDLSAARRPLGDLAACLGRVVIVVPAEVRAGAAAAGLAADLKAAGHEPVAVLRRRAWSGLDSGDVSRLVGGAVIAELPDVPGLAKRVDTAGLPARLPRALRRAARAVLGDAGRDR